MLRSTLKDAVSFCNTRKKYFRIACKRQSCPSVLLRESLSSEKVPSEEAYSAFVFFRKCFIDLFARDIAFLFLNLFAIRFLFRRLSLSLLDSPRLLEDDDALSDDTDASESLSPKLSSESLYAGISFDINAPSLKCDVDVYRDAKIDNICC